MILRRPRPEDPRVDPSRILAPAAFLLGPQRLYHTGLRAAQKSFNIRAHRRSSAANYAFASSTAWNSPSAIQSRNHSNNCFSLTAGRNLRVITLTMASPTVWLEARELSSS